MTIAEMARENIKNYNQRQILQKEEDSKNKLKKFVDENAELTTYISETILKNSLEGIDSGILDVSKFNIIKNTLFMDTCGIIDSLIFWMQYNNVKIKIEEYYNCNPYGDIKISKLGYEIKLEENDADVKFLKKLRGD